VAVHTTTTTTTTTHLALLLPMLQLRLCILQQRPAHVLQLCWHQQLPQGGQQPLMMGKEVLGGQPIDALGELLNCRPAAPAQRHNH
jgi:hypothetical protein